MTRRLFFSLAFALPLSFVTVASSHAEDCIDAAKLSEEAVKSISTHPASAAEKLRAALVHCEKSPSLHYNLALALYKQGKYDEAGTAMETALKLKPDYAKALNDLAFIYVKHQNNPARAAELARKAVGLEPDNRAYQDTLKLAMMAEAREIDIETPPRMAVSRPNAVAVVIGNRDYKNSLIPPVEYAEQDAVLMKKYLTEALGFKESNIIFIKNADEADFKKIFGNKEDHRGVLYSRTRQDVADIFIFYSGHGGPDTVTREGYLIPANADPFAIRFTGYPINVLYENLAKLSRDRNPASVVVVLDACFSGAYNNGMLIKDASPISIEISSPLLRIKNAIIFTSSQANQISSWYPEKGHGLFTYHFLRAIKVGLERKNNLTAAEVEKTLMGYEGVNESAWRLYSREQIPQIMGDKSIVLVGQ